MGDHTETLQLQYDPSVITYEELLEIFWQSHNPITPPFSRQYMSILFYHDEEQKALALASLEAREKEIGHTIHTHIRPAVTFYPAEDYHQKYYLQQVPILFEEFLSRYTVWQDIVHSPAVALVNGYLGGYGTLEQLQIDLELLDLSPAGEKALTRIVERLE